MGGGAPDGRTRPDGLPFGTLGGSAEQAADEMVCMSKRAKPKIWANRKFILPNYLGKPREIAGRQSHGTKVCFCAFS